MIHSVHNTERYSSQYSPSFFLQCVLFPTHSLKHCHVPLHTGDLILWSYDTGCMHPVSTRNSFWIVTVSWASSSYHQHLVQCLVCVILFSLFILCIFTWSEKDLKQLTCTSISLQLLSTTMQAHSFCTSSHAILSSLTSGHCFQHVHIRKQEEKRTWLIDIINTAILNSVSSYPPTQTS
jgi:hypothetical protein